MWGSAPDVALKSESWTALNGNRPVNADNFSIVEPYGIRESEIRWAFNTAYHRQNFASPWQKEITYRNWRRTIGRATGIDSDRFYDYVCPGCAVDNSDFAIQDDGNIGGHLSMAGELTFFIAAPKAADAAKIGKDLGLERECGAGLFARMYVSFGGRSAVSTVKARWLRGSDNYSTFKDLIADGQMSPLVAAENTFTGKMVRRYYGMSATRIVSKEFNTMYETTFARISNSIMGPVLQPLPGNIGPPMNRNAMPSVNRFDDLNEEDIPPLPDSVPQDDHEQLENNPFSGTHGNNQHPDDTIDIE